MALPLPALTFYRLPDQTPAAATVAGWLDALYTALGSAVDWAGAVIPASHTWTRNREVSGTTVAVYATPPVGTAMAEAPMLIWAGAAAGAPSMLSPDSFTANNILCAIVKSPGAYTTWTAANPATSGQFSGFWRMASTTWNSVSALVRVYVSQEVIVVFSGFGASNNSNVHALGAWVEPISTYAESGGLAAESDDRLYGMWGTGSAGGWNVLWIGDQPVLNTAPFMCDTAAGTNRAGVFTPGASTTIRVSRFGWTTFNLGSSFAQDMGGKYALVPIGMWGMTGTGNRPQGPFYGNVRGTYICGTLQCGRILQDGLGNAIAHVVSPNTGGGNDSFLLSAAS